MVTFLIWGCKMLDIICFMDLDRYLNMYTLHNHFKNDFRSDLTNNQTANAFLAYNYNKYFYLTPMQLFPKTLITKVV